MLFYAVSSGSALSLLSLSRVQYRFIKPLVVQDAGLTSPAEGDFFAILPLFPLKGDRDS